MIHFVSGLPRAGSTLLCNVLAQNPSFHATSTSGIINVLLMIRNQWDNFEEFKANPNESGKVRVLKSVLNGYHHQHENKIVFDKSRGWLGYLEMAETILERKAKVLCPVRDLRDVLASMEKLWRVNTNTRQNSYETANVVKFKTVEGRCEVWCDASSLVGAAYNHIKDALARGFADRIHFVKFEELTSNPTKTMKDVYDFLDVPNFKHNYSCVEQVITEDDLAYGIPNLHTIRKKIEPMASQWPSILGPIADKYKDTALWA
jgi:sulfotransferase